MYRVLRRLAIGVGLMLLGAVIVLALLYRAATAPVPEYQALIERTRERVVSGAVEESRKQLESQLTALYSETQQAEAWQAVLTADQINGWLATRLPEDFPEVAEQGVLDPQVLFAEGVATLAARVTLHGIDAVVTIDIEPFVAEDGALALEFAGAKLGSASLPLGQIITHLSEATGEEGLPGRWVQSGGNPVLLIDIEPLASTVEHVRTLEGIEVRDGEVFIAGSTVERPERVAQRQHPANDLP